MKDIEQCESWIKDNIKNTLDPINIDDIYRAWQACSQHHEARIKELEDALNACNLMCDFTNIPAIEKAVKQAITDKG